MNIRLSLNFKLLITLIMSIPVCFGGVYWNSQLDKYVTELSDQDKKIFLNTFSSCQYRNTRTFSEFSLSQQESEVLLGTFGDINFAINNTLSAGPKKGMQVFIQTGGLGMHLFELLNSQGFILALKKCFDGNVKKENIYISELLLIDAIMKGVMAATTLLGTVKSLQYLLGKRAIIGKYLNYFYDKPWGKAIFLGLATIPLTSSERKPEELSILEKTDMQLEVLRKEIQNIP